MRDGTPKAVLYEGFARVGRALGSPARIELLNLLAQGEHGVEELAAAGQWRSNTWGQRDHHSGDTLQAACRSTNRSCEAAKGLLRAGTDRKRAHPAAARFQPK